MSVATHDPIATQAFTPAITLSTTAAAIPTPPDPARRAKNRLYRWVASTFFCIILCAIADWYVHDPAPGTWDRDDFLVGFLYALSVGVTLRALISVLHFGFGLWRIPAKR